MTNDNKKLKSAEEWMLQAEYDIDTADVMLNAGRYIYAIFMTHLSLEKALKSIYTHVLQDEPPRTHNLILLQERIENKSKLGFSETQNEFIEFLNEKSVPSRYPDTLNEVLEEFKKSETTQLVNKAKGIIKWLKKKLKK
ncbi:MAG: HEPN domain-containing protein [Ignavibacteriae bacterium]|nr:HEPN domain-containing protein [Ignavibacteriota bacterium]NOH00233.1 HEPN domain-containing protein [Ignavibacteriota bacterium]